MDTRSRERAQTYRELQLLASPELFKWLSDVYGPAEYRVREQIAVPVSNWQPPNDDAALAHEEYVRILYVELIAKLRPEVASLRNPSTL
jgi:hypothetical protein